MLPSPLGPLNEEEQVTEVGGTDAQDEGSLNLPLREGKPPWVCQDNSEGSVSLHQVPWMLLRDPSPGPATSTPLFPAALPCTGGPGTSSTQELVTNADLQLHSRPLASSSAC